MTDITKRPLISIARRAIRAYMHAPWNIGKRQAYRTYCKHFGWRSHREVIKTRFGDLMEINTPDVISTTLFLAGHWEPTITEYVRNALNPGDIFIDVGANIGYYSILASGIVGNTGKVICIEAHPLIYDRLSANIARNRRQNVIQINAAVSSSRGELPIFFGPEANCGHTTTVATMADLEGLRFDGTVRCDTLESLVGTETLQQSRFIKIDVEGAEHAVLSTLFNSLTNFSDSTEWLLELTPTHCPGGCAAVDQIYAAFRSAGYHPFKIANKYQVHQLLRTRKITLVPITADMQREPHDVLMTKPIHINKNMQQSC